MQGNFTSWKEVAAFFGRSVRTVQRWHVERDLPVRKLQIGKKAYIYADPAELQDWMERNAAHLEEKVPEPITSPVTPAEDPPPVERNRLTRPTLALLVGILVSVTVSVLWLRTASATPGTGAETLTPATGLHFWPSFEPGGYRFVTTLQTRDRKAIVLGAPDALTEQVLAPSPRNQNFAAWSPDGQKIAYIEYSNQDDPEYPGVSLFLAPVDTLQPRLVARFPLGTDASSVSWFPDSRHLAAVTSQTKGSAVRIARIDTLTGASQWLTTPPEGAFGDVYPAVSADGRQVVFQRYLSSDWQDTDLWIQPLTAAGEPQAPAWRLTELHARFNRPAWHPSKSAIVTAVAKEFGSRLAEIPVGNSRIPHRQPGWLSDGSEVEIDPVYDPTTRRWAVVRQRTPAKASLLIETGKPGGRLVCPGVPLSDVMALSPDGETLAGVAVGKRSAAVVLCSMDRNVQMKIAKVAFPETIESLGFSASGGHLAMSVSDGSRSRTQLFAMDGGQARLVRELSGAAHAVWSAEKAELLYFSQPDGNAGGAASVVQELTVSTGVTRIVARLPVARFSVMPGEMVVFRRPWSTGLYRVEGVSGSTLVHGLPYTAVEGPWAGEWAWVSPKGVLERIEWTSGRVMRSYPLAEQGWKVQSGRPSASRSGHRLVLPVAVPDGASDVVLLP